MYKYSRSNRGHPSSVQARRQQPLANLFARPKEGSYANWLSYRSICNCWWLVYRYSRSSFSRRESVQHMLTKDSCTHHASAFFSLVGVSNGYKSRMIRRAVHNVQRKSHLWCWHRRFPQQERDCSQRQLEALGTVAANLGFHGSLAHRSSLGLHPQQLPESGMKVFLLFCFVFGVFLILVLAGKEIKKRKN